MRLPDATAPPCPQHGLSMRAYCAYDPLFGLPWPAVLYGYIDAMPQIPNPLPSTHIRYLRAGLV